MTITTHEAVEASPWTGTERPTTPQGWIRRAEEVAAILEVDAVERDRALLTPHDEVRLLKQAGLVTLLGPAAQGGAGQGWGTAYQVVRRVAEGDGSIGQLLGYHYLWSQLPALFGTAGQAQEIIGTATREGWFFGGAVNPRDADLVAIDTGRDLVFSGRKTFSTGSKVSDVTWLEAAVDGHEAHVFALAPSDHPGITFHDGWDALGQRLTESGSVTVDGVLLPWSAALGWVDKQFVGRTYNTLTLPAIQLVFTNFYLGIAAGGLRTALAYTRERTRPWPYGGDARERAVDEPYILDTYGDLQSKLWAAQALADKAGDALEVLHIDPEGLDPRTRGEAAVLVAAAKQRAIDVGLEIGTRVFEVTGARATASSVGLDRFWRNIRTHSLHDPVAYKRREVGVFALRDEVPEPTWYT